MSTLRALITAGLSLICLLDICAILLILLSNPKYIVVGKYR